MVSRRKPATIALLAALVLAVALVAVITATRRGDAALAAPDYIDPVPPTGEVHEYRLVAAPTPGILTDGVETDLWTYNGSTPGPEIRISHGDTIRVILENNLPEATSIHWHGIRVPHDMDGVPGLTQPPVAPGETFVYEFTPPMRGPFGSTRTSEVTNSSLVASTERSSSRTRPSPTIPSMRCGSSTTG